MTQADKCDKEVRTSRGCILGDERDCKDVRKSECGCEY